MARPILIVGVKHTGKSLAATVVAEHFGRQVIDTDLLIQALDATETDMRRPIREIYRQDGVARFQQLEVAAVELALERNDAPVIATGGGICDNERASVLLRGRLVVHILDSFERVAQRVFRSGIPAFLSASTTDEAREEFREVYARRTKRYQEIATITVDVENLDARMAGRQICSTLEEHISGRQ